jgi:hypothetical protein
MKKKTKTRPSKKFTIKPDIRWSGDTHLEGGSESTLPLLAPGNIVMTCEYLDGNGELRLLLARDTAQRLMQAIEKHLFGDQRRIGVVDPVTEQLDRLRMLVGNNLSAEAASAFNLFIALLASTASESVPWYARQTPDAVREHAAGGR